MRKTILSAVLSPSCSGKPHTQDCARGSNKRRDLIKTKMGVFNKPHESDDYRNLSGPIHSNALLASFKGKVHSM
jgi:hypothetical protein